jgi:hypothetical protein
VRIAFVGAALLIVGLSAASACAQPAATVDDASSRIVADHDLPAAPGDGTTPIHRPHGSE